jgi:hypothetical protein
VSWKWVAAALLVAPLDAGARPGDPDEPLPVATFPFVHASTTAGRLAAFQRYGCAPSIPEGGSEVVYAVPVTGPGTLSAWVDGDEAPVDIDVHLLSSLARDADGTASDCLARGNRSASATVAAGLYYVIVDTYESAAGAGPYRLRVDFQPQDAWYERAVAAGVRLRTRTHASLFGARQTVSVLEVDLQEPGLSIRPIAASGCARTSALARGAGAVAAVNGGFFDTAGCASVSLLKVDGRLLATNSKTRTAFGIDGAGVPRLALVPAGEDWPEAVQALGGVPRIARGGVVDVRTLEEGSTLSFEVTRHPRTAVAIAGGKVLLATVDGRTDAGAGMTLPELAEWMLGLGAEEALNLDGGGSTTLWVAAEPFGGVVNYPSDNGRADHEGERAVASALGVFAPRLDLPAIWLTSPPEAATGHGVEWVYEAVAADPEGAAISYALEVERATGSARLQDRGDGTARVTFVPDARDAQAGTAQLRLLARVAGSGAVPQSIRVTVSGGAGADGGAAAIAAGGGCAASGSTGSGAFLVLSVWLAFCVRRRGSLTGQGRT